MASRSKKPENTLDVPQNNNDSVTSEDPLLNKKIKYVDKMGIMKANPNAKWTNYRTYTDNDEFANPGMNPILDQVAAYKKSKPIEYTPGVKAQMNRLLTINKNAPKDAQRDAFAFYRKSTVVADLNTASRRPSCVQANQIPTAFEQSANVFSTILNVMRTENSPGRED